MHPQIISALSPALIMRSPRRGLRKLLLFAFYFIENDQHIYGPREYTHVPGAHDLITSIKPIWHPFRRGRIKCALSCRFNADSFGICVPIELRNHQTLS